MKTINKICVVLFCLGTASASVAEEEVLYSTEGYCVLANEGVDSRMLTAYAKKLGNTPSKKVCNAFKEVVAETRPKAWDYPMGRPYPGSAIRLSESQIEAIKAASH
ncbi:hypothetical protein EMM73_02885 [Rheinheimera sediminis]|uniref:hypothetical protein n=1 Tax=Rheinheimera sp. YQF-1 TaxID=2499626 RepID=UPI000FDB91CD|nr:hypothetical protein [Rheinheimera sp. YQF-1]RVT48253.1 hypothetical protein EMM73_02885 [Rheinheimera sp. YQF-1]